MATRIYRGYAVAVPAEIRFTPANVEIGDIFRILFGTKTVSFTATAATVANVIAGLLAAIEAAEYPEFDECTWTNQTTYLRAIGPDNGRPVGDGMSTSVTDGGVANTQTLTKTTTTEGTGPEDWTNAENWIGGLPDASNGALIGLYPYAPKYNLPTSGTLNFLQVVRSPFQGLYVGLPPVNELGYAEYLPLGVTTALTNGLDWGMGEGPFVPGGILNITNAAAIRVFSTERRGSNGVAPLQINGGNASAEIPICNGAVDFADPAYTAGFGTIFDASLIAIGANGDVKTFSDADIPAITVEAGGRLYHESGSAVTTLTVRTGSTAILGGNNGGFGTVTIEPGATVDHRKGDVTACHCSGNLTLANDPRAKTYTALDLYAGVNFQDPLKVGTYSAGIDCNRFTPGIEGIVNVGNHVRLTIGTPA